MLDNPRPFCICKKKSPIICIYVAFLLVPKEPNDDKLNADLMLRTTSIKPRRSSNTTEKYLQLRSVWLSDLLLFAAGLAGWEAHHDGQNRQQQTAPHRFLLDAPISTECGWGRTLVGSNLTVKCTYSGNKI